MSNLKPVKKETNLPHQNLPYRNINQPFRLQFVIPGPGITIEQDANGVCYISTSDEGSVTDIIAGDNIEITRNDEGQIVISAVNTVTNITAGQNVTIDIDPETGDAIINSIIGGNTNEHYQGVFDTPEDLIAYDTEPDAGDYGLIKTITISDGETSWNGQYKYCFYINGQWTVVDQMLTFTTDQDLLQQYYSVGGSSPVIYLHEIARSGDFRDLNNVPIVATPEVTVEGTTVTVTCATEGAEIWYTTDGSMPHVNGTKYTGPLTASGATTYRFVGIKNGMINSLEATANADYELQPPTIDFDHLESEITLTNPNLDGSDNPVGSIYYTVDGGDPTSSSTLYTGEFYLGPKDNVTTPRIVRAVVYDNVNDVYSAVSTLSVPHLRTNSSEGFNAGTGSINAFFFAATVNNQSAPGGKTYYTIDGSDPDYTSSEVTQFLNFARYGNPTTIKVKSYAPNFIPSEIKTQVYGYEKPTAPTISFDSNDNIVTLGATGNVTATPAIPMKTDNTNPEIGYRIYYTLDGTTPTANSNLYTGPFQINGSVTVKAIIIAYGQYSSDVSTEAITMIASPGFNLDWTTGLLSMSKHSNTDPGNIYYTLDGSTPTSESSQYSEPILLTDSVTLRMVVIADNAQSPIVYQRISKCNDCLFSQINPNYSIGKCDGKVQTYPAQQDAEIRYTHIGGSGTPADPSYNSSAYSTPLTLNIFAYEKYKFRAFAPGYIPGNVEIITRLSVPDTPEIIYDSDTEMVTISLDGNTADIPLQTNNNVPSMGARIYYTTDGSDPRLEGSTMYDGQPFKLPAGSTEIKAFTSCYGNHFDGYGYASGVATEEISGGGGIYGVRFAKNSDSPDGTRVGDMTLHASLPIQSQMRRCLLLDNGTVNYYLDPDDSTLKADGTAADLSGTDGQYMVEIPEFYAALLETDDYVEFSVSTDPVDGYFHYPTMYVSADEACLDRATGKLAAVVNNTANYRGGSNDDSIDADPYLTLLQRPVSNLSCQDFLDAAQLRGSGWCNYMNMVNSALYFLFITEYATRNTQKAYNPALTAEGYRQGGLGPGVTEFYDWFYEPFIPTGYTASLGNNTGVKDYTLQWEDEGVTKTHTAHVSSYRGVSVPIGHLAKAASGYFLRATTAEDVYAYFRNNPDTMSYEPVSGDVSIRVPLSIQGQLVGKLGFTDGNLYPAEGTVDPIEDPTQPLTTYYCDGALVLGSDIASEIYDPDSPVSFVPFLGGSASDGSGCGFACANVGSDPSFACPVLGSRLCYIVSNS